MGGDKLQQCRVDCPESTVSSRLSSLPISTLIIISSNHPTKDSSATSLQLQCLWFVQLNQIGRNKMTTVHSFGVGPIDCHAWSGDRKQLALSRNSKEVVLYSSSGKGFEADGSLDQHDLRVTGIDWAPKTNCVPIAFNVDSQGSIATGVKLEDGKGTAASGANSAMKMFQNRDVLGTSDMSTKLNTTHQNQISELRHFSGDKASAGTISTVAGDGKL